MGGSAADVPAAAAVAASTTASMALSQSLSGARQDQSQRAYCRQNAFALDNHTFLLTSRTRPLSTPHAQ
jgi:hypothetical protein